MEPRRAVKEPASPDLKYAWLEHDGGSWHFLTNLFEDPCKSVRSWKDDQTALEELESEGWIVVYPYNEQLSTKNRSEGRACGYGLMYADSRMVF